ncbi:helix-turn-helix transcriptional regulator [Haoranjiania flava]|uniref:Helix-turn-helix transcriptional regulator n=1 Tax=Haoranjiania flava TaxID=1856322 RepID=A0AAE3IL30_9BACT|nr:helix-turn-helix transcriptional regulator [Haoranjiania flava]MCU7692900.1 helix-turn-helix transcriptional regulator [Haoranjiania flava]
MKNSITPKSFEEVSLVVLPKGRNDYLGLTSYVETAKAISRASHQCVYIFDYYKQNFLYLPDNSMFLCGKKAPKVKEQGFNFFIDHVPENEVKMLVKINKVGFEFFNSLGVEDKFLHTISYNFHLRQSKGEYILVNHKLTPIKVDEFNNIWLAMGLVTMASDTSIGNVEIMKTGTNQIYQYDFDNEKWELKNGLQLSSREREILFLTAQGLTNKQISENIHLSETTIKFHKSKLFKKMGVNNIAEAFVYITNYLKL